MYLQYTRSIKESFDSFFLLVFMARVSDVSGESGRLKRN